MRTQNVIIAVLAVLLVIAAGFIAATQIRAYNLEKKAEQQKLSDEAYQKGAQEGYAVAITQLMQQAATCNQVPVYANNVTMNLVAVECLQQGQQPGLN